MNKTDLGGMSLHKNNQRDVYRESMMTRDTN